MVWLLHRSIFESNESIVMYFRDKIDNEPIMNEPKKGKKKKKKKENKCENEVKENYMEEYMHIYRPRTLPDSCHLSDRSDRSL